MAGWQEGPRLHGLRLWPLRRLHPGPCLGRRPSWPSSVPASGDPPPHSPGAPGLLLGAWGSCPHPLWPQIPSQALPGPSSALVPATYPARRQLSGHGPEVRSNGVFQTLWQQEDRTQEASFGHSLLRPLLGSWGSSQPWQTWRSPPARVEAILPTLYLSLSETSPAVFSLSPSCQFRSGPQAPPGCSSRSSPHPGSVPHHPVLPLGPYPPGIVPLTWVHLSSHPPGGGHPCLIHSVPSTPRTRAQVTNTNSWIPAGHWGMSGAGSRGTVGGQRMTGARQAIGVVPRGLWSGCCSGQAVSIFGPGHPIPLLPRLLPSTPPLGQG